MGKLKYKKSITMRAYNSENDQSTKIIFNERARICLRSLEWRKQRRKPECTNPMLLCIYFFGILCYCDKQPEQKLLSGRKEFFRVLVLSIVLDSFLSAPLHLSPPLYHCQGKQNRQLGSRRQSKAAHLMADRKWGREGEQKESLHAYVVSLIFFFIPY